MKLLITDTTYKNKWKIKTASYHGLEENGYYE